MEIYDDKCFADVAPEAGSDEAAIQADDSVRIFCILIDQRGSPSHVILSRNDGPVI